MLYISSINDAHADHFSHLYIMKSCVALDLALTIQITLFQVFTRQLR